MTTTAVTPVVSVHAMEREIRSLANTILNRNSTRLNHPTFGVTLTSLRLDAARLDGMVSLYAVLTGQANFWSAPSAMEPRFNNDEVQSLVGQARTAVRLAGKKA